MVAALLFKKSQKLLNISVNVYLMTSELPRNKSMEKEDDGKIEVEPCCEVFCTG